jgi:hypothetical protein
VRSITGCLAAALFCIASPSGARQTPRSPAPAASVDWRRAAETDLEAAYRIYRENHAGWFDPHNPGFKAQLAHARDAGLAEARAARSIFGYQRALSTFNAALSDGHAVAYIKGTPDLGALQWPGFGTAWRGDRLLVHSSEEPGIHVGDRIEGCDGKDIRAVMERALLATNFRPETPGHWWYFAPRAFLARAKDDAARPARCRFQNAAGTQTHVLRWRDVEEPKVGKIVALASRGERTGVGLTEPRPGIFLIGLSDFQPDAATVDKYHALFADLNTRRAELSRARAIVLDLRYNNGGSSTWSNDMATALWGIDYYQARMAGYYGRLDVWWRASHDNGTYLAELAGKVEGEGHKELAESLREIASNVQKTLAKGQPYFRVADDSSETPAKQGKPATVNPIGAPVYVISDGSCASACLDAMDVFSRFDHVKRIGAPTASDTTYMEVRTMDLPSGNAGLAIPIKLLVGRPRASGAVYEPDIAMTSLDWSTRAFLDRIEVDLPGLPAR